MKSVFSVVLCFLFVFCFSSCNEEAMVLGTEKIVAVEYDTINESACEEYTLNGFSKVTYNSSSDVVLAVENKKADFGILDEFELNSFIQAGRKIQQKERCKYKVDYCAYFSAGNSKLQKLFNEAIGNMNKDGTLEKIKTAYLNGEAFLVDDYNNKNGTLVMLCDHRFENRVFTNDSGEIIGLDVDIARAICNYLGYGLEIVTADFDELFVKLEDGEGDFIISACEFNEDRAEVYLASNTYFTLNYYIIERA